jgi:DNA replication protein DnaC
MMSEQKEAIHKAATRLRLDAFTQYEKLIDPKCPFEDNLRCLLEEQVRIADIQRLNSRMRYAGFPQTKTFDTFVTSGEHLPYLNFDELRELSTCAFIEEKSDVVAIGPAGRGKTHIALALGYEAIKRGYSVKFKRAGDLLTEMSEAKGEKRLAEFIKTLNRCQCLILDEVGYLNYDLAASSLLFQVLSARYEKTSTIYTTNLEFSRWTQFIGDPNLATAIISRIAHHAIILNTNGPKEWRLENARSKRQRKVDRTDADGSKTPNKS